MMSNININGLWTFVVVYGAEYGDLENQELIFEAEFSQNEDTFTAVGIDKSGVGMSSDLAKIRGFLDGDTISFVKQYEFSHYASEDGNTIIDKNNVGHEINYFGTYDSTSDLFYGDWDITTRPKGFWYDLTATGTWTMRRVS